MDSYGIFDRGSCVEVLFTLIIKIGRCADPFIKYLGQGCIVLSTPALHPGTPNRRPLTECPDPPMIIRSLVSPLPYLSLLHCIIGEQ